MDYPLNCAVMMGLPRSGTTIISRVIGGHSQVKAAIEPYHSRKQEQYEVVNFSAFLADGGGVTDGQSLMVKETTTRLENVNLSLSLLRSAVSYDVRPLALLVLRSPVEAYLSQVEAAQTKWNPRPDFNYAESWVEVFAKVALRTLHAFLIGAQRYHKRVILYRRFINQTREETRRVMAAFPYFLEPSQLDLISARGPGVGDPSAWKSNEITGDSVVKRMPQVQKFSSDFSGNKLARSLVKLDLAIAEWAETPDADDDEIWNELERIVRAEFVQNNMSVY
jgi:hypothetical protein